MLKETDFRFNRVIAFLWLCDEGFWGFGCVQHQGQRPSVQVWVISETNRTLQTVFKTLWRLQNYTAIWGFSIGLRLSRLWHKSCKMDPNRELNTLDISYSVSLINRATAVVVRVTDMIRRPTLLVSAFLSICWADTVLHVIK